MNTGIGQSKYCIPQPFSEDFINSIFKIIVIYSNDMLEMLRKDKVRWHNKNKILNHIETAQLSSKRFAYQVQSYYITAS